MTHRIGGNDGGHGGRSSWVVRLPFQRTGTITRNVVPLLTVDSSSTSEAAVDSAYG